METTLIAVAALIFGVQLLILAVCGVLFRAIGRLSRQQGVMWERSNVIVRRVDRHIGQWEREQQDV